ncbi:MAG: outer membrane protein assembly factor BamB [Limisphaerales bacterium]|jgi:outer membrane protein assembly factor BamB
MPNVACFRQIDQFCGVSLAWPSRWYLYSPDVFVMENQKNNPKSKPTRWWPAVVVIVGFTLALAVIWSTGGDNQQYRVLRTLSAISIATLLIVAWALFFSRLAKRTRLLIFGGLVGAALLFSVSFRFSQFSGNMMPIYEWRWANRILPTADGQAPKPTAVTAAHPLAKLSFPQFLGPSRDCKIPGPNLATDWDAEPPKKLWRQPIGAAWSGFVVASQRAVTQEQRGEDEAVVCYDLQTGAVLWLHTDAGYYKTTIAGEGPRATPTIHDGKVYTLGATGVLNCLDLATGKPVWQRHIAIDAELDLDAPVDQSGMSANRNKAKEWGYASSPLIVDDKVVVSAGGENGKSLFAYDTASGEPVWSGGNSRAGYSSARLAKLHGETQILIFNQDGLAAHSPQNGSVAWEFDWGVPYPHVSMPVSLPGNRVLLSLGYGKGSKLLQVDFDGGVFSATELWKSIRMKAKFTNLVFHDGHIFGLDDGMFACIDAERGRRQWKDGRYGHGQILLRGSHILVMAENGDVVLLEANPEKQVELTKFAALDGKTWNPPALAGDYLLVRNHREAACYKLPLAKPAKTATQ